MVRPQKREKDKKRQNGRELYKNLSVDEKEWLVEHRKKYYKMTKILVDIIFWLTVVRKDFFPCIEKHTKTYKKIFI